MKKEDIKLIISDIDGTLINDNDELPHNFIEMIDELAKRDIIFVAASGRGILSIKEKLQYEADNLYIISDNGAITSSRDKIINVNSFNQDDFIKITKVFQQLDDVTIATSTHKDNYAQIPNEQHNIDFLDEFYASYEIVDDLSECVGEFVSVSMHHYDNTSENYQSELLRNLSNDIDLVQAGANWIDALPHNNNKGIAVTQLAEILDIDLKHTIGFGDYNNDIQMLQTVNKGYAMMDATDSVKAVADEIIGSNNDNSVIKKIYELLEIK